jgi:hypothetical protein
MPKVVPDPGVKFEDGVMEMISKKKSAQQMSFIEKLKHDVAVEQARLRGEFFSKFY